MSTPPSADTQSESDSAPCSQTDSAGSSLNSAEPLTGQNLDTDSQMEDKDSQMNDEDDLSEDDGFSGYGKPLLPYRVGFEFTAISQELQLSTESETSTETETDWQHDSPKSQLDFCLSETTDDVPSDTSTQKKLIITSLIRVGSNRGAQIVVVNNDLVAKIYDPLYYKEYDDDWFRCRHDTVDDAKYDYDREVAAYNRLQESTAATQVTPTFHGAWLASIATPIGRANPQDKRMRAVRLILIEYLRGECMASVDPHEIPRPVRSQILKKVLDAEALIINAGVNHGDLHPRNVILSLSGNSISALNVSCGWDNLDIKVRIIDFNVSVLVDLKRTDERFVELREKWPGRLTSPVVRFHRGLTKFDGWCPNDYSDDDICESIYWLWRHYRGDDRYFPTKWDPKDPSTRPVYL